MISHNIPEGYTCDLCPVLVDNEESICPIYGEELEKFTGEDDVEYSVKCQDCLDKRDVVIHHPRISPNKISVEYENPNVTITLGAVEARWLINGFYLAQSEHCNKGSQRDVEGKELIRVISNSINGQLGLEFCSVKDQKKNEDDDSTLPNVDLSWAGEGLGFPGGVSSGDL
jgi:hypothetical protein